MTVHGVNFISNLEYLQTKLKRKFSTVLESNVVGSKQRGVGRPLYEKDYYMCDIYENINIQYCLVAKDCTCKTIHYVFIDRCCYLTVIYELLTETFINEYWRTLEV